MKQRRDNCRNDQGDNLNDDLMKVPCLEIDGLVLTQSVAIMEYLADRWLPRLILMMIMLMLMLMIKITCQRRKCHRGIISVWIRLDGSPGRVKYNDMVLIITMV